MPRKKIVTTENIIVVTNKLKRLKKHQQKKVKVGETSGNQSIYRYPSITKALIAKVLRVSSDYLTSVKDEDIKAVLKPFGQNRAKTSELKGGPNPNTKEYYRIRTKELNEELELAKKKITKLKVIVYDAEKVKFESNQIVQDFEDAVSLVRELRKELAEEKQKNTELRATLASARMENDRIRNSVQRQR